jgi:hypothetical protein
MLRPITCSGDQPSSTRLQKRIMPAPSTTAM